MKLVCNAVKKIIHKNCSNKLRKIAIDVTLEDIFLMMNCNRKKFILIKKLNNKKSKHSFLIINYLRMSKILRNYEVLSQYA